MSIEELSAKIVQRRKKIGITQSHLAELADIHLNTVVKIERGKLNPTFIVLSKIAHVLGMELKIEIRKMGE